MSLLRSSLALSLTAVAVFFCFCFNICQIFLLFIHPISPWLFYHINSHFASRVWTILQFVFVQVAQGKIEIIEGTNSIKGSDSAIVLSNHCSSTDWYLLHQLSIKHDMLGYMRYMMKRGIKYIPFFGWGLYLMRHLFIERNWLTDKRKIKDTFQFFANSGYPVWIVEYLEGSRISRKKIEESQKFCKKNGYPVLNNVLFPRTKGFVATVETLRSSHIKHVYILTMGFYHPDRGWGAFPSFWDIHIKADLSKFRMHIHTRQFALSELPEDPEKLSQWARQIYVDMDLYLERLKIRWIREAKLANAGNSNKCAIPSIVSEENLNRE